MTAEAFDGGLLVQRTVYAGLEALRAAVPLDLAAYLHQTPEQGPQLFLGVPTLADIDPTAAFNLFSALRDGLAAESDAPAPDVPGYHAIAISTTGGRSRGVHVLGRTRSPLEAPERALLDRLVRTFAALTHDIEEAPSSGAAVLAQPPEPTAVRVMVETVAAGAEATVTVVTGSGTVTQKAEASSTYRAVAMAAVAAVDPSLKVVDAGDEQIGGSRAALALVEGAQGAGAIGSALVDDATDTLRAIAAAALDAAARLAG